MAIEKAMNVRAVKAAKRVYSEAMYEVLLMLVGFSPYSTYSTDGQRPMTIDEVIEEAHAVLGFIHRRINNGCEEEE